MNLFPLKAFIYKIYYKTKRERTDTSAYSNSFMRCVQSTKEDVVIKTMYVFHKKRMDA